MTGQTISKRALVALWCIASVGCARVADNPGREPARAPEVAAETIAPPAAAHVATQQPLPEAPVAIAEATPSSIDPPSPATSAQIQSPASSTDASTLPEEPVAGSAAPALGVRDRASDVGASAVASSHSVETLDFASLMTRLRKTKAINLRTKLAFRNESDDLLEQFRAYHARRDAATLAELRRSYDSLFHKVYSLLQDADPPLALEIDRSHGVIWEILKNPTTFGAAVQRRPAPSSPRA
jgi:hypothetical protein